MKLVRYGEAGSEKPGLLDDRGAIRDLSGVVEDIAGEVLSDAGLDRLRALDVAALPVVKGSPRLGPPVGSVSKLIAIGLNYRDHAAEAGMPIPNEPIIFTKAISCLCGPNDNIELPEDARKVDWELEIAFVIGRKAKRVPRSGALSYVAGYTICNDVSERAFQIEGTGQWVKGKSLDTFGPVGPWLVTRDEVPDPQNLDMWLDVSGRRMQTGNTRTMIFPIEELVSFVSRFITLMPGDIVTTGTPPGVALGMKEPRWLRPGDEVRLWIEGLGEQRQNVVAA
jgi:2-keto-4-pentenoate hydratase/2-oxohepta-3-ene-1,7-dioic acid hydratase in catechol pathway